jgi:hypothetical protein
MKSELVANSAFFIVVNIIRWHEPLNEVLTDKLLRKSYTVVEASCIEFSIVAAQPKLPF